MVSQVVSSPMLLGAPKAGEAEGCHLQRSLAKVKSTLGGYEGSG